MTQAIELKQNISPITAFINLQSKRPSLTVSYFVKNYLLLLNSITVSLGPKKKQFKKSQHMEPNFDLGFFEDIYTEKIYFLEGTKGSKYITLIELEKTEKRYDLYNIIVKKEKAFQLEVAEFFLWLKNITENLSLVHS